MEQTAIEKVTEAAMHPGEWTLFAAYMGGVGLRACWRALDWYGKADTDRAPLRNLVARTFKGVILGVVLGFVWTQGLVGNFAEWLGYEQFTEALGTIGVTIASSVAVGFFLEWLVGGKILAWFGAHREPGGK